MHSAAQLEQIKASMLAFGFTIPVLVDIAAAIATNRTLGGAVEWAQPGKDCKLQPMFSAWR